MKKKIAAIIIALLIAAPFLPAASYSVIAPYFVAVNDTLLPYNTDTMPYISGSIYYVPFEVFGEANVWSAAAEELDRVRMYRGDVIVDFHIGRGVTEDRDGNVLQWPPARKVGGRYYVPLRNVCDYFGLTYEILDVPREIIPEEQMRLIRIRSTSGPASLNNPTFFGINAQDIRSYYDDRNAATMPPPPPTVSPGEETSPPPVEEPPPTYEEVTIHHSFYNITAGGADVILELLRAIASPDYRFCFFVSSRDIAEDAGLVRRIAGSGHSMGIWLEEGTYDEYLRTSALLFEAAKVKTVLVTADSALETIPIGAPDENRVIYWETTQSIFYDDTLSVNEVTDMIPRESGERQNLISACSENTALMLSGILSYLREFDYSIVGITETTVPMRYEAPEATEDSEPMPTD